MTGGSRFERNDTRLDERNNVKSTGEVPSEVGACGHTGDHNRNIELDDAKQISASIMAGNLRNGVEIPRVSSLEYVDDECVPKAVAACQKLDLVGETGCASDASTKIPYCKFKALGAEQSREDLHETCQEYCNDPEFSFSLHL